MPQKIKILHLVDHLGSGGVQEIIKNLVISLDASKFDHEIIYFFNSHTYRNDFVRLGVPVHCLNFGRYSYPNVVINLANPFRYVQLLRQLRSKKADVVHIHLYYAYILGVIANGLYRKSRVLYTMHAMKNQVPIFFILMGWFSTFVRHYVADLPAIADEMRRMIHNKNIQTITVSTPLLHETKSDPSAVRSEFRISVTDPIALSIARLHSQKGHIYQVSAFRRVVEKTPRARLIIVGSGPEKERLRALIQSSGLKDNIFLAGFRRNIVDFYDCCDVFISTPQNESLGLVILDALARAKPVVAFDVGAIHKTISNDVNGFLIKKFDTSELAEKITLLFRDRRLRERMGSRGRQLIQEQYSYANFTREYESVYEMLAQEHMT
ncbi:MAG: glycosyltransferase [Candidatus Levybacteria bacterium]|nr:glycosyltransferase [Candidatus Levybacteria bacterium]